MASDERSQARNRDLALARLAERLAGALKVQRLRRPTRPTQAAKERRLGEKRRRGDVSATGRPTAAPRTIDLAGRPEPGPVPSLRCPAGLRRQGLAGGVDVAVDLGHQGVDGVEALLVAEPGSKRTWAGST